MAPSRRKGTSKAAAAAAAARREWKVGDLVLAKVKGFPAWPATVSDPVKWGYPADWKKVLVYFFGTQQIAFCNPADVEEFSEEKKESLLGKRHGKGADFVRAVREIIESYEKLKQQTQNDEIKVEKVPHGDANSEDSSPKVLVKDLLRFSSQSSNHQPKGMDTKVNLGEEDPPVGRKDAVDVAQDEDIGYGKTSEEQLIDNVKEARPLSTYSLRRRSGGSRLGSSITKKRALLTRRSRSSSGLSSSKFESSTLPCEDAEHFVGVSSSNSVMEVSGRRSRRTRRSVDVSKGEDLDSPSISAYSSMEESGSEVVSMDSDNSHGDSAVESGSKHGRSEIAVEPMESEHVEGPMQQRKSLDLDVKAVIVKRKRKPNRKRLISDTVELNFYASQDMVASDSGVSLGNCPRENGDEHLPLVKRARVRMSKLSAAEAICAYHELEEQSPSQNLPNPPPLSCFSADNDINASHLGAEAIPQDATSLETCLQYPDVSLQVPKDEKNPPAGSTGSADVEAALPPSKRLHRALEAMSANATEPRPSSDEASLVIQIASSDCHISPVQSYSSLQMALDGKDTKAFGEQIFNSIGGISTVNISGGSTLPDLKNPPETADSAIQDDDLPEVGLKSECEMLEKDVENGAETRNVLEIPSAACMIVRLEEVPGPEHLVTKESESRLQKEEALMYEVSHGRDVRNGGPDFELPNHDTGGTEKLSGTPKCSGAGVDNVLKDEARDAEIQTDQMEKYDSRTEMTDLTDIEHSITHEDGCSQDLCQSSHNVPNQVVHENGSHAFSNGHLSEREESAAPLGSASLSDREHCSHRVSPPTASACHLSTSASSRNSQSSGSASPAASSHFRRPEFEPSPAQPRSQDKLSNPDEVHATLSSFEAALGGLTRTKESIGRATRVALDCAKFGIAAKVVDLLARTLEREPSLYKRVDLFFLIDSIMQSSRGLKGEAGGMYISIVQSKLSRLVTAAAPPGHTAQENRRQCLKVLRLWLERRILPESILRQHIRELDVMNGSSSAGPYSRRSARTERAFDDPIREMEGMLVDEYGSNSSFQLPGFCMPRMRKDDDEGSESDESFEAVTPERPGDAPEDEIGAPVEKRGHILQDVDGELEMEDVAPLETEINDASTINSAPGSQSVGQQFQPAFAPPPPQDIPPSSAPLPLSSLPPPPPPPFSSGLPSHLPNGVDQNAHRNSHDVPSNMTQHGGIHHMAPRDDHRILEPPSYHSPDFREREKQMPVPHNDGSYGRRPMNNFRENDGPWDHRGYPLRPPHHGDQLSYDQRFRSRRDPPPPSHSRYHSPHNRGNGGNHYNHHPERLKPPPHDMRENWRFSGPYSEPRYHDKARNFHPGPYDCPPYDHPRMPNHGWGYPPRPSNYRNNVPFRPPYEGPNFWRP